MVPISVAYCSMGHRSCGLFCLHCCMNDRVYICGSPFVFVMQRNGLCFAFVEVFGAGLAFIPWEIFACFMSQGRQAGTKACLYFD